uniref:[F-actin]-monooxygenase MICAL1-3-like Rossman domain-containing protein n=1 Tax=Lepeophtheirus salmonis TaxID=72036 RepID=A0A0K2SXM6_LEPSM
MPPLWTPRRSEQASSGPPPPKEAIELFISFYEGTNFQDTLESFVKLCEILNFPFGGPFSVFYPKLKRALKDHLPYKYKEIWKILDKKAAQKPYGANSVCENKKTLVVGCGPCGLRTAVETQLLGSQTVILERRGNFSRNNVLKIWKFLIDDLKMLGAKKLFGSFCSGAINHIGIRTLQLLLSKIILMMGVKVLVCTFDDLIEPTDSSRWKAKVTPSGEFMDNFEFDFLIIASGKKVAIEGFNRRSLDAKLSIAITANFQNKGTSEEKATRQISGISRQYDQQFFKAMVDEFGISLENLVYYRGETHYFVMTALKKSLLDKGVLIQDEDDRKLLLAPTNVNKEALYACAKDAALFATKSFSKVLPHTDFQLNSRGQPDVAIFDFTNLYSAKNSCKIRVSNGCTLLMSIVGDSLLEPFWPEGTGCARGFLSCMDAAWMFRQWCVARKNPMDILAERENIYKMLTQTSDGGQGGNLKPNYKSYTTDPKTRYRMVPKTNDDMKQKILTLYETDNSEEYQYLSDMFLKGKYFEEDKHKGFLKRVRHALKEKKTLSFTTTSRVISKFKKKKRNPPAAEAATELS